MSKKGSMLSGAHSQDSRQSDSVNAAAGKPTLSGWEQHSCVPLPIQSFLWRQTNPFLGPKVGKLHEASCVTFERVVVQNILHGLSPSLSDAIGSIPRWRFIRAAFPHVVQCCSALLNEHRHLLESDDVAPEDRRMSNSLAKILYILHWMVMDSAKECFDEAHQQHENEESALNQLVFPLNCIQLFVYLLAPLVQCLTDEDISGNIRLETGVGLWQSLWENRQPDILCFSAPVKPRKSQLKQLIPILKQNIDNTIGAAAMGIYCGDEETVPPPVRTPSSQPLPSPAAADVAGTSSVALSAPVTMSTSLRTPTAPPPATTQHPSQTPPSVDTTLATTAPISTLATRADSLAGRRVPAIDSLIDSVKRKSETRMEMTSSELVAKPVVRSVSEYRKKPMDEVAREHKRLTKTSTNIPDDTSGAFRLQDLEQQLKFMEEGSGVVEISDLAPLVALRDICSDSIDTTDISPTSQCEVICEQCNTTIYREGVGIIGQCRCTDTALLSTLAPQLRVVPVSVTMQQLDEPLQPPPPPTSQLWMSPESDTLTFHTPSQPILPPPPPPLPTDDLCPIVSDVDETVDSDDGQLCSTPTTQVSAFQTPTLPEKSQRTVTTTIDNLETSAGVPTAGLVSWSELTPPQMEFYGDEAAAQQPVCQLLSNDPLQASYFDVAVLRCLFVKHWDEEGVYWATKYFYHRLVEINDAVVLKKTTAFRHRSCSVPASKAPQWRTWSTDNTATAQHTSKTDLEIPDKDEDKPLPTWQNLQQKSKVAPTSSSGSGTRPKVAFFVEPSPVSSPVQRKSLSPLGRKGSSDHILEEKKALRTPPAYERRSSLATLKMLVSSTAAKQLELKETETNIADHSTNN